MTLSGPAFDRILLGLFAAAYLLSFRHTLPHGDALRVVHQIETSSLHWNPNHLLFDPIGYGFHNLLSKIHPDISPLVSFEVISICATIFSLAIFYQILLRMGVGRFMRLLTSAGLFSSASFIEVAGSSYFFMIQMPFLLGAIYFYIDFIIEKSTGVTKSRNLWVIGVLLALATGILFNNVLVTIATGVAVALSFVATTRIDWRGAFQVYVAAATVGFSIFVFGHAASGVSDNLIVWVFSYAGDSHSVLNEFYGIAWTLTGVMEAAARAGFKVLAGNVVATSGLPSVLWVLVFGKTLEFVPNWTNIALSLVVLVPTLVLMVLVLHFAVSNTRSDPIVRFVTFWLFAYVLFAFLWDDSNAIFWMQTVPLVWLLILLRFRKTGVSIASSGNSNEGFVFRRDAVGLLVVYIAMLLVVNSANVVALHADREFYRKEMQYHALLGPGDLHVLPGWDRQKWLTVPEHAPNIERITLMGMALAEASGEHGMEALSARVHSHLQSGKRVVVARLYDLDDDVMPWHALERLGWPRARIQHLLSGFCNREVAAIGGVIFREIYVCEEDSIRSSGSTRGRPWPTVVTGSSERFGGSTAQGVNNSGAPLSGWRLAEIDPKQTQPLEGSARGTPQDGQ